MKSFAALAFKLIYLSSIFAYKMPFSTKLFHEIVQEKHAENIIFSPASIKSCLGLAFMGAEGQTAKELYDVLQLSGENKNEVGQHFEELLKKVKDSGVNLKTANRIYLAERYTLSPKYKELISKYFESTAQKINFADTFKAAKNINSWVEEQTNNKIHDIVSTDAIDASTTAFLVNAIYFKATWKYEFDPEKVRNMDFLLNVNKIATVEMMHNTLNIRYGELPDLNAKAVELPYSKSDIHMLIILPNEIDGLSVLEKKLKNVNLTGFQLQHSEVNLKLPKFKIEFEVTLNDVLKNMGLEHVFANADLSGITSNNETFNISRLQHKAFIEVDEHGTEAAAATHGFLSENRPALSDLSLDFFVDHPFFFAIKDRDSVYFAGHIVKF